MSKTRIILILWLSALLMSLSACQVNNTETKSEKEKLSTEIPNRKQIAVSDSHKNESYDIAPLPYANLAEAAADSIMVFRGEVVNVEYVVLENGSIHTREDIKVLEVLDGQAEVGDIVKTQIDGGYILLSEYLAACDEERQEWIKESLQSISSEEYDSYYYEVLWDGEKAPIIGDESVYFFKIFGTEMEEGFYTRTMGRLGEYFLCHDGQYLVPDYVHSPDLIRRVINGEETKDYEGYTKISYEELLTRLGVGN
ncbi:MAG: hypothetical protein Q4D52_04760 [Eubacteriales bacterium]|nr:hypothetical protein [Eubacteriales bacterium]